MTQAYQPPRDRDAFSTIRGFVYQVDLTVLRWLDLPDSQHLELERGEDIDLVGQAIAANDAAEAWRVLEQVKHRERNLTLREPAAIEALANAVEHLRQSRDIDLRFCYTTNARVGTERPPLFPHRTPAITVWERIRCQELEEPERSDSLRALQRFLSRAAQPPGLDDGVWLGFQQYIAAADEARVGDLVGRFEWSTLCPEASALGPRLQALLRERGLAADEAAAEQRYQHLFLFVFKLLCQRGIKRLTAAGLREQLARPTLAEADHALRVRLREHFRLLERRVDVVEVAVASLNARIDTLAEQQAIRGAVTLSLPVPELDLPPLVPCHTARVHAVQRLAAEVQIRAWSALHGGPDTGKSQLALLVARHLGSCRAWIRLNHESHPARAGLELDLALEAASGMRPSDQQPGWYRRACDRLGRGTLVVLDDLPRLLGHDQLSQRLVELVTAVRHARVLLLSTSLHPAPPELLTALGADSVQTLPVPALTDLEAREILAAHGAPASFLAGGNVRFINGLAAGHPLLLTLATQYLKGRGWRLDDANLDGLLRGEHASGLAQDVIARLMRSLGDDQRELLYRLTLVIGGFTFEAVSLLAGVPRPVPRPRECLQELLGAWVQRDTDERLVVSPLVRAVGAGDLLPQTRTGCHIALADHITSHGMSPFDAEMAIGYYLQANELGRAGTLFVILLQKIESLDPSADVRSTVAMWADLPLPEGMDLGLRLLIRALQLGVLPKFGRRIDFVLGDIDRLLASTTEDQAWSIAGLAIRAVVSLAPLDPDRALRYLSRALSLPVDVADRVEEELFTGGERLLDELLWHLIRYIDTPARLRDWLAVVESLPTARRERLFEGPLAAQSCLVLADRLLIVELGKAPADRRWREAIAAVGQLADWALRHNLRRLRACAIRSEVYGLGELREVEEAAATAEAALAESGDDPTLRFLVAGAAGRYLVKGRQYERARPLLARALEQPVEEYPHERMLLLLAASHSHGVSDGEAGVRYARQAVELARAEETIPPIEAARACAELAVAQFLQCGPSAGPAAAFEAWSEAAERLFAARDDSDQWKDTFVVFGHMNVYLTSLAATGRTLDRIQDGSAWAPPERGLFLLTVPERVAYYRPSADASVMWLLAQYADAVGNDPLAIRWLSRASEAVGERLTVMQSTIARDMIPTLLLGDQYDDVIDNGLKGALALHAFRLAQASAQPLNDETDLAAIVDRMSAEQRAAAERDAMPLAVIPAMLRICTLALTDQEAAFQAGRTVASACRQVSDSAQDRELWEGAAEVFDRGCREDGTSQQLIDLSQTFRQADQSPLGVLCYLGTALHGTVEEAFVAQLCVVDVLFTWIPPKWGVHRRLLIPYVEQFWSHRLAQQRFSFRAPSVVEAALAEARTTPLDQRVRAVLRAVRIGVQVKVPEQCLAWLNAPAPGR